MKYGEVGKGGGGGGEKTEEGMDGWEFWGSVYGSGAEAAELRREMDSGWRAEPRLSELLAGQALRGSRLELRGLRVSRQLDVKQLVEAALGPGSVLDVRRRGPDRWHLRLYSAEKAQAALRNDWGRGVEAVEAGPPFPALPSMESRGLGWGEKLRAGDEERAEQGLCLSQLLRRLAGGRSQPIRLDDPELAATVAQEGSVSLREHVGAWPAGALRAGLLLRGPLLSWGGGPAAQLLLSSLRLPEKEPWEPLPLPVRPLQLEAEPALVYLAALVGRFGPLWTGDPRLHVLLGAAPSLGSVVGTRGVLGGVLGRAGLGLVGGRLFRLDVPAQRLQMAAALRRPLRLALPPPKAKAKPRLFDPASLPPPIPNIRPLSLAPLPNPKLNHRTAKPRPIKSRPAKKSSRNA